MELREHFPRGLDQPPGGFRFSADALLLACFAEAKPGERVLDLGAGCGVVGLGLLLRCPGATVLGLDRDPAMVAAARENAAGLGFSERHAAHQSDVRDIREESLVEAESCDLVLANPPYRLPGTGREADAGRRGAVSELHGELADFVAAAAYAVKNRQRVAFVFGAERADELLATLARHRLQPKRLLCVHGRARARAKQVLVEARKNGGPGLLVEAPLILYHGAVLTRAALDFCPFLACNPGKGPDSP